MIETHFKVVRDKRRSIKKKQKQAPKKKQKKQKLQTPNNEKDSNKAEQQSPPPVIVLNQAPVDNPSSQPIVQTKVRKNRRVKIRQLTLNQHIRMMNDVNPFKSVNTNQLNLNCIPDQFIMGTKAIGMCLNSRLQIKNEHEISFFKQDKTLMSPMTEMRTRPTIRYLLAKQELEQQEVRIITLQDTNPACQDVDVETSSSRQPAIAEVNLPQPSQTQQPQADSVSQTNPNDRQVSEPSLQNGRRRQEMKEVEATSSTEAAKTRASKRRGQCETAKSAPSKKARQEQTRSEELNKLIENIKDPNVDINVKFSEIQGIDVSKSALLKVNLPLSPCSIT